LFLRELILQHYRNYAALDVTFAAGLVVLQGANAQGKTNLLEAIYLLATTRSSRTRTDAELISWREHDPLSQIDFARVVGRVERTGASTTLEIVIRQGAVEGQTRKRFKLNGAERRAGDVLGRINAVFFAPTDVDLVAGSPSVRRRYLDVMLCQVDAGYVHALGQYNRAVLQRNALLRQVRERQQPPHLLDYWDDLLAEQGGQVLGTRAAAVRALSASAAERHVELSAGQEALSVRYKPALLEQPPSEELANGGALVARDWLRRSIERQRGREIAAGVSLYGPHRDDLAFEVNGVDATAFGSRGQQRTATLALKLAELEYMRSAADEQPILLLDDATSELDARRRDAILAAALQTQQTFMTSADGASLGELAGASQRWEVADGTLRRLA
jgi:DNA replication and repair protein RecF